MPRLWFVVGAAAVAGVVAVAVPATAPQPAPQTLAVYSAPYQAGTSPTIPCAVAGPGPSAAPVPETCTVDTGSEFDLIANPALAASLRLSPSTTTTRAASITGTSTLATVAVELTVGGATVDATLVEDPAWDRAPVIGVPALDRLGGGLTIDWVTGAVVLDVAGSMAGSGPAPAPFTLAEAQSAGGGR